MCHFHDWPQHFQGGFTFQFMFYLGTLAREFSMTEAEILQFDSRRVYQFFYFSVFYANLKKNFLNQHKMRENRKID